MGYQWKEITQNFNRSLPFTKVRWDLSQDAGWATTGGKTANGAFSETPGVNTDGLGWSTVSGATYGYAGQNRFTLRAPIGTTNGYVFSCRGSFTDRSIKQYATQISTNVYEYTYPKTLYWAGIGISTLPYSTEGGTGVYVYVQASTFEITPTETATTYESGATTVTVNTDNDTSVTWTASTTDSWLSLSPATGAGDGSVTITYAGNSTYSPRTGVVTFTSSEGETLTFTLEQEEKPVLVYDRPIYRSGSLVKKMYRSGELIYWRLNPPTQ